MSALSTGSLFNSLSPRFVFTAVNAFFCLHGWRLFLNTITKGMKSINFYFQSSCEWLNLHFPISPHTYYYQTESENPNRFLLCFGVNTTQWCEHKKIIKTTFTYSIGSSVNNKCFLFVAIAYHHTIGIWTVKRTIRTYTSALANNQARMIGEARGRYVWLLPQFKSWRTWGFTSDY